MKEKYPILTNGVFLCEMGLLWNLSNDDNNPISYDNHKPIIVPYNPDYKLNKSIIYQEKYDGEKNEIDQVRSILIQLFLVYQKSDKKNSCYKE